MFWLFVCLVLAIVGYTLGRLKDSSVGYGACVGFLISAGLICYLLGVGNPDRNWYRLNEGNYYVVDGQIKTGDNHYIIVVENAKGKVFCVAKENSLPPETKFVTKKSSDGQPDKPQMILSPYVPNVPKSEQISEAK